MFHSFCVCLIFSSFFLFVFFYLFSLLKFLSARHSPSFLFLFLYISQLILIFATFSGYLSYLLYCIFLSSFSLAYNIRLSIQCLFPKLGSHYALSSYPLSILTGMTWPQRIKSSRYVKKPLNSFKRAPLSLQRGPTFPGCQLYYFNIFLQDLRARRRILFISVTFSQNS